MGQISRPRQTPERTGTGAAASTQPALAVESVRTIDSRRLHWVVSTPSDGAVSGSAESPAAGSGRRRSAGGHLPFNRPSPAPDRYVCVTKSLLSIQTINLIGSVFYGIISMALPSILLLLVKQQIGVRKSVL